jgi:hypothetical protein
MIYKVSPNRIQVLYVYILAVFVNQILSIIVSGIPEWHYFVIGLLINVVYIAPINVLFLLILTYSGVYRSALSSIMKCLCIIVALYIVNQALHYYFRSLPDEIRFRRMDSNLYLHKYFGNFAIDAYSYTLVFLMFIIRKVLWKIFRRSKIE